LHAQLLKDLIERVSGSDQYKEEYDKIQRQKEAAEEENLESYEKKKKITTEKNELKKQKEEAENYDKLREKKVSQFIYVIYFVHFSLFYFIY
jgi:chromosome segregation ATPase